MRGDGIQFPVEITSSEYQDSNGNKRCSVIVRDISERRQAEDTLYASEKKYRSIFENVQDVYYETLLDGTILEVSPSIGFVSEGQYSRADLIGKSMYDFYPDSQTRDTILAEMQKTGIVTDFEVRLRNKDGSFIQCSISAKSSINAEGRIEKIVGSMHGISERKRAENALHESEKRFQTLAEISPVGIFRTNTEGSTTYVNPRWCQISGVSSRKALGHGWLTAVHPEDREKLNSDWKRTTYAHTISVT